MTRPKIGLALGSGGARGYAHIGVLKVLEKHQIPIDYIAGTSMGSFVGVLYANGINIDLLGKLVGHMKRKNLVDLVVPKRGLIRGTLIKEMVRLLTHGKKLEQLAIPTAVVATDLLSGDRVVFKEGPVDDAVRASIFLGLVSFIIVISFILHPDQIFTASLRGLKIWWDIVFPALLPFFIVSELMMGVGLAHFFGVLLEPLMRPLFNIPGSGAFALTMGFASGYPVGAKLTVRLREQNMITRSEGERLVSFASSSDPLFMFGAVAVGFFHDVSLGIILATVHYISSILIGIMMRFHDRKGESTYYKPEGRSMFIRAFKAMHDARLRDGRAIGKLMGDAVSSSLQTLLLVGGLIIIFSVLMTIFSFIHITAILGQLFSLILILFGLPTELHTALINGLFEVTLGAQGASLGGEHTALIDKVAIASAVLAWGGLSVHAQIASILSTTDIRYKPYLFARMIHIFIAALLTYLAWGYLAQPTLALPTFLHQIPDPYSWQMWGWIILLLSRALVLLTFLIVLSLMIHLLRKFVRFLFPRKV